MSFAFICPADWMRCLCLIFLLLRSDHLASPLKTFMFASASCLSLLWFFFLSALVPCSCSLSHRLLVSFALDAAVRVSLVFLCAMFFCLWIVSPVYSLCFIPVACALCRIGLDFVLVLLIFKGR